VEAKGVGQSRQTQVGGGDPLVPAKKGAWSVSIRFGLVYSVLLNHMAHFFGHTHTKRDRRESTVADRGVYLQRMTVLEGEPAGTSGVLSAGDRRGAPTHSKIAELAYSYWEARGYQGGSAWEDWFRAERESIERSEQ
jgi:hypothetical protein